MSELSVEVDSAEAQRLLADIYGRLDVRSGVGRIMSEALVEYVEDVFDSGGHGKWARLDPATVKAKRSNRVLVDTGTLLDALTDPKVRGDSVAVSAGPDAYYATFLKEGARGTPKRDPAPEPTHGFIQDLSEQLVSYIADGVR